jgi:hypothetical protein
MAEAIRPADTLPVGPLVFGVVEMHNRIRQYLPRNASSAPAKPLPLGAEAQPSETVCSGCDCPKCRKNSELAAVRREAKEIESKMRNLGSFEVHHDRKQKKIVARLWIHATANIKPMPADTNLAQHTINELRRVAAEMLAAADRLEWMDG